MIFGGDLCMKIMFYTSRLLKQKKQDERDTSNKLIIDKSAKQKK